MADNKPKFIDKFWPISTIKVSRTGQIKEVLAKRMENSKNLIAITFGIKAEKVVDTFIKAYLASDKDYPAPSAAIQNPKSNKDLDLYDQYIIFLWEYYVKDKNKTKSYPKEPKISDNKQKSISNGLSLYEGIKEEDLVDEEIDERILKILGIQDIFDIDYGTYLTLLKEKMVAGRMNNTKIPVEEVELLTNEWKRVKGKVGRFKIKSKKITADNIGTTGPVRVSKQQFFLAGKVSIPEPTATPISSVDDGIRKNLDAIKKSLFSIVEILSTQNKLFEKERDNQRKLAENIRRSKKEEKLEGKFEGLKNLASKVLAPVQSILDKIINFLVMTLLGRLVYKFMDWIRDPKNKKKIDVLLRFIGDWWPALLGAFVLFATPLGKFVRTIIGTVTKLTLKLGKFAIPKVLSFVKANPVASALIAGGAAVGVGAYVATQQTAKTRSEDKKKDPSKVVLPEETANTKKGPGSLQLVGENIQQRGLNMFRGGGLIKSNKNEIPPQPIKDIGFTSGGEITSDTGLTVTGAGKDTQLIAARPGEIVISKEAVDKYGANFFLGLNKSGGGTNIPKIANNIQLAAGGGMVGGKMMERKELNQEGRSGLIPSTMKLPYKKSNAAKSTSSVQPYNYRKFVGAKQSNNITPPSINLSSSGSKVLNITQSAAQSAKPISQKMPFVLPLINNVATLMGEVGNKTYNFEKRSISIMPKVKQTYVPEPPSSGKPNIVMLPPVKSKSSSSGGGSVSANRDVPEFSAFLPTAQRKNNIQIYGIIGVS